MLRQQFGFKGADLYRTSHTFPFSHKLHPRPRQDPSGNHDSSSSALEEPTYNISHTFPFSCKLHTPTPKKNLTSSYLALEVLTTSILFHTKFTPKHLIFTFPATSPTKSNYPKLLLIPQHRRAGVQLQVPQLHGHQCCCSGGQVSANFHWS